MNKNREELLKQKSIWEHFFEENDYMSLIKNTAYTHLCDDMHDFAYIDLDEDSELDRFLGAAFYAYGINARLNDMLNIKPLSVFDNDLIYYIACRLLERFPNAKALQGETQESLAQKIACKVEQETKIKMLDDDLYRAIVRQIEEINPANKLIPRDKVLAILKEYNRRSMYEESGDPQDEFVTFMEEIAGHLKPESFADAVHVTGQYVREIMKGKKIPEKDVFVKISLALKLGEKRSEMLFSKARRVLRDTRRSTSLDFNMNNKRDRELKNLMNNFDLLRKNYPKIVMKREDDYVDFANQYLIMMEIEPLAEAGKRRKKES